MEDHEASFVEHLGQHLYTRGMQRMAARMWAWLLICDPAEQTAEGLARALHASRGAISGAARDLANAGLIRRGRRRGERREYFSAPPGTISRLMLSTGSMLAQGREIADEGLALLADRPSAAKARLLEFRDAYAYYEREWPRVIERYFVERDGREGPPGGAPVVAPGRPGSSGPGEPPRRGPAARHPAVGQGRKKRA